MASNRKSNRNLVETIEEELNRYNENATNFAFKDGASGEAVSQIYTVPSGQSGWYKIELWGASGGSTTSETGEVRAGGKGAYTSGLIYLVENEEVYFFGVSSHRFIALARLFRREFFFRKKWWARMDSNHRR